MDRLKVVCIPVKIRFSTILDRFIEVLKKGGHVRDAIRVVPDGVWSHEVKLDGIDEPLTIRATVQIEGSDIHVDYSGTSPQIEFPLNSVPNYTYAYTVYPVRWRWLTGAGGSGLRMVPGGVLTVMGRSAPSLLGMPGQSAVLRRGLW
jgi:hypothetical protein